MSGKKISEIKRYWDNQALRDRAKIGSHSDPYLVDLENRFVIEKCLKRFRPKHLLDIGCGNGRRTNVMARHVAGKVVGIDYSRNMIDNARRLQNEKLGFYLASVLERDTLEGISAPFDCVVSFRCLINLGSVENQRKAVHNICELLKPGGVFVFCEGLRKGTCESQLVASKIRPQADKTNCRKPGPERIGVSFYA